MAGLLDICKTSQIDQISSPNEANKSDLFSRLDLFDLLRSLVDIDSGTLDKRNQTTVYYTSYSRIELDNATATASGLVNKHVAIQSQRSISQQMHSLLAQTHLHTTQPQAEWVEQKDI